MSRDVTPAELGFLIRAARERKGLLQRDVAGELGVTTTTVIRWERGKGGPVYRRLLQLAVLLDAPELAAATGVSAAPDTKLILDAVRRVEREVRQLREQVGVLVDARR